MEQKSNVKNKVYFVQNSVYLRHQLRNKHKTNKIKNEMHIGAKARWKQILYSVYIRMHICVYKLKLNYLRV